MYPPIKRGFIKLCAALGKVVRLPLTALPPDVPVWRSENLIGVPLHYDLLEAICHHPIEPLKNDAPPEHEDAPRIVKKPAVSAGVYVGSIGRNLTAQEMREHYQRAISQARLRSKPTLN